MVLSRCKCYLSIISLVLTVAVSVRNRPNTKIEPKSPSTPDVHADVHTLANARGIAQASIVKLRKGTLMNNYAKLF